MSEFKRPRKIVATPAEAETLLLIDVSNLAYRSLYAFADLTTASGVPSGHVYGSINLVLSTVRNQIDEGKICIVFCYEGRGATNKRREILPEYKTNRDYEDRFNPIWDVREALAHIPGVHLAFEEKEGDDAIAWAVEQWHHTHHIVVLSGDRDLWALLRYPNVKVYSPNVKDFVTNEHIEEHFGCTDPQKIYLAKSLYGDSSDGIKGLDRLQKAQVNPIINRARRADPEAFYAVVDDMLESVSLKGKTREKVLNGREVVERNFKVIMPNISNIDPEQVIYLPGDEPGLRELLERYECKDLATRIDTFFGVSMW